MTTMTTDDWRSESTITVERAADVLGIGRSNAYTLAGTGELPTLRLGRCLRVPVARLRRMLGELPENDNDPAGNRAEVTTEDTRDVRSTA